MTAFNTATNTGSTTFTNSWGTISLLPSASPQYAYGFERNDGWRYFEVYIDNAGGDNGKLFAGYALTPSFPTAILFGGNSEQAYLGGGAITPHPYLAFPSSITAETGDVFMFAVDLTGYGRNHAGVPQLAATISSGTGTTLHPLFGEIGKNGTWLGGGLVGWEWASGGYPTRAYPVVARDSTSASAASVSLRVETTSFAYAIPSGMIAWADGPAGAGTPSVSASYDIHWDPLTIGSDQTLTNSNFRHNLVSGGVTLSAVSVKSTVLPTTGKRVVEFYGFQGKPAAQTISSTGSGAGGAFEGLQYTIGLCDAGMTSISWSTGASAQPDIAWDDAKRRRGTSKASSMTQVQAFSGGKLYQSHEILYIDFDSLRIWERRGLAEGNAFSRGMWGGRTISNSDGPDPYAGRDGMTFSASGSGTFRLIAQTTKGFAHHTIYLNAGQEAFQTYPLLPGWQSMDGTREVFGIGSVWDTGGLTSISVCYTGLGVRGYARASDRFLVRNSTSKSTGKWYFNIFAEAEAVSGTLSAIMGLLPTGISTLTAAAMPSLAALGIWYSPVGSVNANRTQNTHRFRYGVTTSYTQSMTMTSVTVPVGSNAWYACAVDFDLGHIWFGSVNPNRRKVAWHQGADPATDTNPDLTFTANTAMNIAITPPTFTVGGANGWWILAAESGNAVDIPSGFTPWNGTSAPSTTATPSGATGSGGVLWPYGVMT